MTREHDVVQKLDGVDVEEMTILGLQRGKGK